MPAAHKTARIVELQRIILVCKGAVPSALGGTPPSQESDPS
jgi:hypothetical protein